MFSFSYHCAKRQYCVRRILCNYLNTAARGSARYPQISRCYDVNESDSVM